MVIYDPASAKKDWRNGYSHLQKVNQKFGEEFIHIFVFYGQQYG